MGLYIQASSSWLAVGEENLQMGVDIDQPSRSHNKDKEESRPGTFVSREDAREQTKNIDGATAMVSKHDKESKVPNIIVQISNSKHTMLDEDAMSLTLQKNLEPHDGMEFDSKEDAFSFYKEYAKSIGFAAIIKASRRSRVSGKFIDAKFVCSRYGNKRVPGSDSFNVDITTSVSLKRKRGRINQSWSKTDCKACLHVKRRQDGQWVIHSFIKEHNHKIFSNQEYCFQGHLNFGNDSISDCLHTRSKKMYATMSRNTRFTKKVKNKKSSKVNIGGQHLALEDRDAQIMLEHFLYMQDENPFFFHAIDVNKEQNLRNVFWVDAKSRLDYCSFSDVVFFDTTYIKNDYKLPFAPFMGVNHHFQFLLLGCALISEESKSTFIWVMRAWLRAMHGQAPKVILTDQDKALKEAIADVFPNTRHCFCLWHILSNIQEKLGYVIRRHDNFINKFNKCILNSETEEKFEKRWKKMIDRFNLRNDLWIQSLYEDRIRWVPVYMKDVLLAGMSTTQRLESASSPFDRYIQRKTTLGELLDQFKTMLQEKYEDEAKEDFETSHKQIPLKSPSPFGKQMSIIYTHAIFKKFQVEVLGVVACHPRKECEDGITMKYKVQDFEKNQDFVVVWNERTSDTSCSCRFFEYNGFLCRHVMIVLQMAGVHNIPPQHILKRWTRSAKCGEVVTQVELFSSRIRRCHDLCQRAFRLGEEGSSSQGSYTVALKALEEALRKCEKMNNSVPSLQDPCSPSNHALHDFGELTKSNSTSKASKKSHVPSQGKAQLEQEMITIGMHDSLQHLGDTNMRALAINCSYESRETAQGMGQLNSRVPTLDGYFGTQQFSQGVGQLNTISSGHDDYYSNQPKHAGAGTIEFNSSNS